MRSIAGSSALVTGAAAGLGRAIAEEFVAREVSVVCVDCDGARLEETVSQLSHRGKAWAIKADLRHRDECRAAFADATRLAGDVEILVNNAGVSLHQPTGSITLAAAREVFDVNFFAPVLMTTLALPTMLAKRSGSIINVASVAGHIPTPFEATYGASKAALWRWSHNVDMELRGSGVRVSTLSPGPMETEIWDKDNSRESYSGKLYAPRLAALAAVRLVTNAKTQRTAPRQFALPGVAYAIAARPTRWALRRFSGRHPCAAENSTQSWEA
jgi:short-subunit dehydrogenase